MPSRPNGVSTGMTWTSCPIDDATTMAKPTSDRAYSMDGRMPRSRSSNFPPPESIPHLIVNPVLIKLSYAAGRKI